MAATERLRLRRGGTRDVTVMHDLLVHVYTDAHAHHVATGNPFDSPAAFGERLVQDRAGSGFSWVGGWVGGELAGYAYGQRPDAGQWLGDAFAEEAWTDPVELFVTDELMVRQAWRGQGIGRLLHDGLTGAQRGVTHLGLYVRPDNETATHLYRSIGYERVGTRQLDHVGAPLFDVLTLRVDQAERGR